MEGRKIKVEGGKTEIENKVFRIAGRLIALVVFAYYGYYVMKTKEANLDLNLNGADYTILGAAGLIIFVVEAVRWWAKKKMQ